LSTATPATARSAGIATPIWSCRRSLTGKEQAFAAARRARTAEDLARPAAACVEEVISGARPLVDMSGRASRGRADLPHPNGARAHEATTNELDNGIATRVLSRTIARTWSIACRARCETGRRRGGRKKGRTISAGGGGRDNQAEVLTKKERIQTGPKEGGRL